MITIFIKTVNSNLSFYANQIQKGAESGIFNNNNKNLFGINKSISNMKLIENWLKKEK
jgi:hypothetical protein